MTWHFSFLKWSREKAITNPFQKAKIDGFVKSRETPFSVIPAEAGIQPFQGLAKALDPGDPVPAKAGNRGDDFL